MAEQMPWRLPCRIELPQGNSPFMLSSKGEIWSWTVVREPPAEFVEFKPYIVAIIRLDNGPLVTAQITDLRASEVAENLIGMKVEAVIRILQRNGENGLIVYGYKFRPLLAWEGNQERQTD